MEIIESMISIKRQCRIIAFQALYQFFFESQSFEDIATFSWITKSNKGIKKYAKKLFTGTEENKETIVTLIKKHALPAQYSKMSIVDRIILEMTVFEIIFLKGKASIIIDEAIHLSKSFSTKTGYKMLNAILDSIAKTEKYV